MKELSMSAPKAGLMAKLSSIQATISKRIDQARTRRELNYLTDRELADIGITRGEIHHLSITK